MRSKITLLLIIIVGALYIFRIWQTTGCKQFLSHKFEPISITISVESDTNLDHGTNKFLTRFFHNKISTGSYEISKSFAASLNSSYLLQILGPLGTILASIALYQVVTRKIKLGLLHVGVILLASFFSIVTSNAKIAFYIQSVSLLTFSLWGTSFFSKSKFRIIMFLFVLVMTFVFFLWTWQMNVICNNMLF